ncbi:MAG: hypothetical protein V4553_16665 [Bacteroidota bacterium]
MAFNTEAYITEKANFFVDEIKSAKIGLVGFKTKLKYFLSTLNNEQDKRLFVNKSLDILFALPNDEQLRLKDFIYVLNGTVV